MQMNPKRHGLALVLTATACLMTAHATLAMGYGDTQPRAMGMAGSYTAMARGAESMFWNPANLALSDSPKFSLPLTIGASLTAENNSLSIADYNKYTGAEIWADDKDDILGSIDSDGMQFNTDLGLYLPLVSGIVFPMPWNLTSALSFNVRVGMEGAMPRDLFELLLYGNEFAQDRIADGKDPNYDIAEWDGEAWALGVLSWSFAKPYIPWKLMEYLDEMTVGATVKVLGGGYAEVVDSGGGFETQVSGISMDAYGITQGAGGYGFGVDLGVAGITKDRKTTIGLSLVNALDYASWSIETKRDCVFVSGDEIRVTSFTGQDDFDAVLDNPRDEEGDIIYDEETEIASFSRSLPAMLRFGVAHSPLARLTVAANYDQAFSSGFGISTTPRLSAGLEYRLVDWFPVRFGLSGGGRAGRSSALGFAFGPFAVKRFRLQLLETAVTNRGGFFPGVSQGIGYSINLIQMQIKRAE